MPHTTELDSSCRCVHVQLPRQLAQDCMRAHVPRLIHVSALGADLHGPSLYQRSKAHGEAALQSEVVHGLPLTVLRPSVIFGEDDAFINLFARLQAWVPVVPVVPMVPMVVPPLTPVVPLEPPAPFVAVVVVVVPPVVAGVPVVSPSPDPVPPPPAHPPNIAAINSPCQLRFNMPPPGCLPYGGSPSVWRKGLFVSAKRQAAKSNLQGFQELAEAVRWGL